MRSILYIHIAIIYANGSDFVKVGLIFRTNRFHQPKYTHLVSQNSVNLSSITFFNIYTKKTPYLSAFQLKIRCSQLTNIYQSETHKTYQTKNRTCTRASLHYIHKKALQMKL